MANIKVINKLNSGIDSDTSPEALDNKKLRDASNMDILNTGEYTKLANIKGTTNILQYLPNNTDVGSLNILGVFNTVISADYIGSEEYVLNKALTIFTYDAVGGSQIFTVDLIENRIIKFYPNNISTQSLDFPTDGTVSASFTVNKNTPEIYWDDNKNELRKLTLKYSTSPTFQFPSFSDISVRHKVGGIVPDFVNYGTNGYTTAGTYQIAYRFYNTVKNTSSKWSLFTNPIPLSNGTGCFGTISLGDGGNVGQIIQKSIIVSVDTTNTPSDLYNSIQLAIVKNIDGLTIPSNIVYITLPSKDWYNTPSNIEYSDAIGFEAPFPIETVITEDASIKSAKTQLIKDNVLVRGNIEYYDFTNDRGATDYDDALTIRKAVCYGTGQYSVENKSHFREEVYAFAVAYFDEFFNFGLVEPLDFTKVYKMNAKRTITVFLLGTLDSYNQTTILVSSTSGLECGDYLRYQNKAYQVCEINSGTSMLIKYRADLTTTSQSSDMEVLYGQEGNQAINWAWKFPARSDNKFTILQDDLGLSFPQAIGLRIKGLKNYPSWAKGAVIVRQDRIKNILFQTPHIPAVAVQGVPTQGIGPITFDSTDVFNTAKFKYRNADYKGQLDFIAPKIFGLGHACNIPAVHILFNTYSGALINGWDWYYVSYVSAYVRQKKNYTDNPTATYFDWTDSPNAQDLIETFGAETPNALFCVPPDYILNNNGEPTFNYPLKGNEKINVVDAVALYRNALNDDAPYLNISNAYQAIGSKYYYYSKDGYITRGVSNDKDYFVPLSSFDADNGNIVINKEYNVVLGQTPQTIDNYIFNSDSFSNINLLGGTEQLSLQQGQSPAILGGTYSFNNTCASQRAKMLITDKPILDFTKALADSVFTDDDNPFPNISKLDYSDKMLSIDHLIEDDLIPVSPSQPYPDQKGVGFIGADHLSRVSLNRTAVKTIFTEEDKINSGAYILNITKGYPDNRYNKVSDNWKFTGTVHFFTEDERLNNTPIDLDVWGGDCFLTDYQVKVNNNTPRVSDIFQTVADEAKDYKLGTDSDYCTFDRSTKTGSFQNNVEFLHLIIESEVNTGYLSETEKIKNSKPTSYYSKPFLYQYNGSYSINNALKSFVTKQEQNSKRNKYPARFVWSKTRLYEAENSSLINTEGFDFFPVNNKKDLDEQYGGITSLVEFGDYMLYLIQESKIRTEPINRTVTNTADGQTQIMLSTDYVGSSGQYLKFDNGSQHMRTIKYFNGTCMFLDAKRRMLVSFGSGYDVLSDNGLNRYFLENYSNSHLLAEKDILGIINSTQEKEEYWLIKNDATKPTTIIFNSKTKNFKTRINTGSDKILNGVSNGDFMYLLHDKSLFTAYTNKYGFLLDKYRPSTFKFIVNDYPGYTKTFNVMNFEMRGGFILNKDKGYAVTPSNLPNVLQQTDDLLKWNSASGIDAPFKSRNFQYWLNRIRQIDTNYKLRGDYMEVEFIINNDEVDNREVSIASITTDCEINARVK